MPKTAPLLTFAAATFAALIAAAPAAVAQPARVAPPEPAVGLRQHVNMIGADDRRPLQPIERQKLRGVVRLLFENAGSTAWFVGNCRTVVATYHGVFDNAGAPWSERAAIVVDGELREFRFSDVAVTAGIDGGLRTARRMHLDYAILELPWSVPGCGPIDYRTVAAADVAALNGAISMVGFHGDHEDGALLQADCPAYRGPTTLFLADFHGLELDHSLFHGCDTVGGSSGAPLLVTENGISRAVGLNVASVNLDRANLKRRHRKTKQIPDKVAHQNPNLAVWFHPCAAIVRDLDRVLGRPAGDCATD